MKRETIVIVIIAVIGGVLVSFAVFQSITEEYNKEGMVTDKYILPRFNGEPVYYLVLDNETDIKTTEDFYYKFNIGDYYKPFSCR